MTEQEPSLRDLSEAVDGKRSNLDIVTETVEIDGAPTKIQFLQFTYESGFIIKTPLTPHTMLAIPEVRNEAIN